MDGELVSASAIIEDRVGFEENQWLVTAKSLIAEMWVMASGEPGGLLVIEEMKIRSSKPEAWANLVEITRMTGALGALWPGDEVRLVDPGRWTKRLAKPKHQIRTRTLLTPREVNGIVDEAFTKYPKDAHSEILDAVGIGLHICGRTR